MSQRAPEHRSRGLLTGAATPFLDEFGHKGWLERVSHAQRHVVSHLRLEILGWPQWTRPLRVAFLADFHAGSHSDDVTRIGLIIAEAASFAPDLVLFGGDYVNMQRFGGGRIPPQTTAAILARLQAQLGRFAVLGNHDYAYDEHAVADALRSSGITVLDHERASVQFNSHSIQIVGVPDAHIVRSEARSLLAGLSPDVPAIALVHDPVWFAHLPAGPHLMLAGHTHGGQIRLPGIGIVTNASKAPLRWSRGLINERGQYLFVTSGVGTSGVPVRWGVPPEFAILDLIGKP
jgi:uncharacterized protein